MRVRIQDLLKTYKIQEFAELAGITVKAPHHYDRVRLLKPSRASWIPGVYRAVRWLAEGLHMMRGFDFDRAADFIDRTLANVDGSHPLG